MVRRRLALVTATLATAAVVLAACGGGSDSATPDASGGGGTSAEPIGPVIAPNAIGMQVEGVEVEAWPSAPFGALRLWDNGTAWSQIELKKGQFKWDNLDGAIANATSKGMSDILMVLGTTPEWAASKKTKPFYPFDPKDPTRPTGANSAPKDMQDWDDWVTAVVTRYKGQISAYEIWNEASLKMFYSGSPEQMAEMTKRAYDIIKANDPEATVVAASPSLRTQGSFDSFYPAYLKALGEAGWPIDVFSYHAYPAGDGDPTDRVALVQYFKKALTDAGAPAKPIWDTELNFGLKGPGDVPKTDITEAAAAGWVVRAYIDTLREGVDRAYWYIWTQKPYPLLGIQAYPGSDGEQGFFAVENWVVGSEFGGCEDNAGVVTCTFARDGQQSIVAWSEVGDTAYTVPAGAQLVCDPLANCQEAAEGAQITLTEVPVRLYLQA